MSNFKQVQKIGTNGQLEALCPAHDDTTPSLHIKRDGSKVLVHCKGNCSASEIVSAVGLKISDLFLDEEISKSINDQKKKEAIYSYKDKTGQEKFRIIRYPGKEFRPMRPHKKGKARWKLPKSERIIYNLPGVIRAKENDEFIYYCEGEKDADNLIARDLTATTHPFGSDSFLNKFISDLMGTKIILLPDNDDSGEKFAEKVAKPLHDKTETIKVINLPGLAEKEDITDWINKGHTADDLINLSEAWPEWKPEEAEEKEEFKPSGIANELIDIEEEAGNRWTFVAESGQLYYYDDDIGVWHVQNQHYLKKKLRCLLRGKNKKWDKRYNIKEALDALQDKLLHPLNEERFDPGRNPNKKLINVKNGMLEWETGKLHEHEPSYYSLFQLPIKHKPKADCPKWKQALKDWIIPEDSDNDTDSMETISFLQEFIGYCLIPDCSHEKAVILTGSAENGKSTFLGVIEALFGEENLSQIPLHRLSGQNARFTTSSLKGKLVNIMADIDNNYIESTGTLKTLIGKEKKLHAEIKYGEDFEFFPVVRLIFSANEIPQAQDRSEGWYRRFEIVPFPNRFPEGSSKRILNFEEQLIKELPGIFNWALAGLRRLKQQGHFTKSKAIKEAKSAYIQTNDSVMAYLNDRCKFNVDDHVALKVLFNDYVEYCEDTGLKNTSKRKFSKRLRDEGLEQVWRMYQGRSSRCYYGLTIK